MSVAVFVFLVVFVTNTASSWLGAHFAYANGWKRGVLECHVAEKFRTLGKARQDYREVWKVIDEFEAGMVEKYIVEDANRE